MVGQRPATEIKKARPGGTGRGGVERWGEPKWLITRTRAWRSDPSGRDRDAHDGGGGSCWT
jgi:hypothetical protein